MVKRDREIDDPGLNQDATFDRKDEERFDDSDDFHKHDDTSKDNNIDTTIIVEDEDAKSE